METTAALRARLHRKQTLGEGQVQGLWVKTDNRETVFNLQRQ
jgi:hypothetical protein